MSMFTLTNASISVVLATRHVAIPGFFKLVAWHRFEWLDKRSIYMFFSAHMTGL